MKQPFVDRIEELRLLNRALKYDGSVSQVLVYTGIGGMGKTALRIAIEEQLLKPKGVPYAVLDYERDSNVRTIESTLRTIRRQLGRQKVRTPVFDFLYGRYFELSMGIKLSSKSFPPELEGVIQILEGLPVVGSISEILHGLTLLGLQAKERVQHKEWLYRVRELEPHEMLILLPEVLAEDLEEAMTSQVPKSLKSLGCRITLLFDAYELLEQTRLDDTLHRDFLLHTPHLLRVIFTRSPLSWENQFSREWADRITHIPALDTLSKEDAAVLLLKRNIDEPVFQEYLYQLTRGYPLHLDLCADIYHEIVDRTNRKPGLDDFRGAAQAKNMTEELLSRLLRQLTDTECDLIRLAAYPRWITKEMLEILSSVPESVLRVFKKFIGLSIFYPHAEIPDAYVMRKEVRDFLMLEERMERLFSRRHKTLAQWHREQWRETQAFYHLVEAVYHGFYENAFEAVQFFSEHFWQLLGKCRFGDVETLLGAVPAEILDETVMNKVNYARARFLTSSARSKQHLLAAKQLYEGLIASEKDQSLLGQYHYHFGDLLAQTGEYAQAMEHYQKSITIQLKVIGEEHPETARTYNSLGIVSWRQADYEKALLYYMKSLNILQKVHGEKHPEVARLYNNIGIIYYENSKHDEALRYYEKSLAINAEVFGEEHLEVAKLYINIGNVYFDKTGYDKALEHFEEAVRIQLKILGSEHASVARAYNNIGVVYNNLGEYGKALDYHEKSLSILEKIFGAEHPHVAQCYHNIGISYEKKSEYEKALVYFQQSLAIRIKVYTEEHPLVADSCTRIAHTLWALKRNENEAITNVRRSIAIYKKFKLWKEAAESIETLAQWLEGKGENREAEDLRLEASKIRQEHCL